MLRVDEVRLPCGPPLAPSGWPRDFVDPRALAAEVPGEATPVAARALDAEGDDAAEATGPRQETGVALDGRGQHVRAELSADAVEGDGDVLVLVGVNADHDVGPLEVQAGHEGHRAVRRRPSTRTGGQDCEEISS